MISTSAFALALAAVAAVNAVPLAPRAAAPFYRSCDYLEDYSDYLARFTALDCGGQTTSDFYAECCLPLHKTESLSDKPARCTPVTTSATVAAEPTAPPAEVAPPVNVGGDPTTTEAPAATTAPASGGNGGYDGGYDGGDDGDDDEDCTDEPEESSAPASEPTEAPANPAPEPTTTEAPAEPTTTTDAPPPATTTASGDNGGDNGGDNSGDFTDGFATFFYQNGNAGACGEFHADSDLIGAIDQERYGYDFGVKSSECGRRVRITNPQNGKTVDITITDVCPTCKNGNSIDLSAGAFNAIATEAEGMVGISWHYLS